MFKNTVPLQALWYLQQEQQAQSNNTHILHQRNTNLHPVVEGPNDDRASMPFTFWEMGDVISYRIVNNVPTRTAVASRSNVRVRRIEVRRRVSFADLNLDANRRTKIWGRGAVMSETGYAAPDTVFNNRDVELVNGQVQISHSGIGGCELVIEPENPRPHQEATLRTYVYQVLDNQDTPTGEWFPCPPNEVVMHYTVFSQPNGDPPPVMTPMFGAQKIGDEAIGAQEPSKLLGADLTLFPPAPNPSHDITFIRYIVPETITVSLELYDLLGNKVKELVKSRQTAGEYQIPLLTQGLAPGTYRLNLRAFNDAGKVIIQSQTLNIFR